MMKTFVSSFGLITDMTEIQTSPSTAAPGKTNIVIFGASPDEVNAAVMDLADQHNCVIFTLPARCADGRWGIMGRVWDE